MSSQQSEPQPERIRRSFHVVTKPIGSACNCECTYCYYLRKEDLLQDKTPTGDKGNGSVYANGRQECPPSYTKKGTGRIDDELLEEFIRQYIEEQDADTILFNWHGGEPALLGLDFYRKAIDLEKKYASGKTIEQSGVRA